jgi:hypothetical protein
MPTGEEYTVGARLLNRRRTCEILLFGASVTGRNVMIHGTRMLAPVRTKPFARALIPTEDDEMKVAIPSEIDTCDVRTLAGLS